MMSLIQCEDLAATQEAMAVPLHALSEAALIVKTANQFRSQYGSGSHYPPPEGKHRHSCGFAAEGRPGQAYNQEAFGYFLTLERKRSERSGRPLLLLLVELKWQRDAQVETEVAGMVFDAIGPTLRETDFIGWYRDGRIIGAVLTQSVGSPAASMSQAVHQRVGEALKDKVAQEVSSRLRVRVYQVPPNIVS